MWQLSNATTAYRADLEKERAALMADVQQVAQEVARQRHRGLFLELKAPQAGIVKDLATHTPGTVVSPGSIVLSLVPDREKLQAEVYVKNEDVGPLRAGLPVKVKVAAYRFQKYGMLDGTVVTLSPDSASPEGESRQDRPASPPSYKAIVALSPTGGERIYQERFTAGLLVSAEIHVSDRAPFEYLFDPLSATFSASGREL